MSKCFEDLMLMLDEKITFGDSLILKLKPIEEIEGVTKLKRKIKQEIEFLRKLKQSRKIKHEQLSCSNLRHLGAMVDCALRPGVLAVCKIFHVNDESKLVIDIISDEGKTWTKVIARNPKSLSALSSGNSSFGARSIRDQAEDYMDCAKLYPCMYQPPKVIFEFVSGIEENLAHKLKMLGVIVKGELLPNSVPDDDCSDNDSWNSDSGDSGKEISFTKEETKQEFAENTEVITTLNLDVTTMMAYISNMTNGHCNYKFKQDVLTQQSAWEAERPVKPILEELFKGKTLVCCQTAWDDFEKIVKTLGGSMEMKRMIDLKKKLKILSDDHGGADDYPRQNLKVRGHVRLRSKIIFNFGHRIKALTVSANEGFVRAAKQQGVTYAAYVHESRALTEGKENVATMIPL